MSNFDIAVKLTAVDKLTAPMKRMTDIVKRHREVSERLVRGQKSVFAGFNRGSASVDRYKRKMSEATRSTDKLARHQKKLATQMQRVNDKMKRNSERMGNLKGKAMGAIAASATAFFPLKKAIEFESTMADVRKVVDFKTPDQFKKMSSDLLDLSKRLPVTATGLGDIMAESAQGGVAREELLRFTEEAGKMAVAFDLSGKQAGQSMVGMKNIFKMNIDEVVSLGDAYNHLSNNMAAKASDLVEIANRSGSNAKLFGISGEQLGALGATMKALQTKTEVVGTGLNAIFTNLTTADKQGAPFQEALKGIGLSAKGLKKAIKEDAQGALLDFLEKIKGSKDVMGTLVGLFGKEYSDDVAKLVGGLDQYKAALALIEDKEKYKGSMLKEYETRAKTTENNLTLFWNKMSNLQIQWGTTLLPAFNTALDGISAVFEKIHDFFEQNPLIKKWFSGITAGILILIPAIFVLKFLFTALWGVILSLGKAFLVLGKAMFMNPIGLITLAVVALIGVVYLLIKHWDLVKQAILDACNYIVKVFDDCCSWMKGLWESFWNWGLDICNRCIDKITGIFKSWGNGITGFFSNIFSCVNDSVKESEDAIKKLSNMRNRKSGARTMLKRNAAVNQTINSKITISQAPGENQEQLAQRVIQALAKVSAPRKMYTDGQFYDTGISLS